VNGLVDSSSTPSFYYGLEICWVGREFGEELDMEISLSFFLELSTWFSNLLKTLTIIRRKLISALR
jgi:hypothetical protein